MSDTLDIFGKRYNNVEAIIAIDSNGNEVTYTRGGGQANLQSKSKTYSPTTSKQTEVIVLSAFVTVVLHRDLNTHTDWPFLQFATSRHESIGVQQT